MAQARARKSNLDNSDLSLSRGPSYREYQTGAPSDNDVDLQTIGEPKDHYQSVSNEKKQRYSGRS